MLGVFVGVSGADGIPTAWRGAPMMLSRLVEAPEDALVRQVEPDADSLTVSEIVTTDSATGLAIRQTHQWLTTTGILAIRSTLTNTGTVAQRIGPVRLVDWRFRVGDGQDGVRYRSLTYRNDVWYGSTYWTGPDWTRVGKDWHHPGVNTPSVRRFTAPRDGRVTITGRAYKADTNGGGGDGVRLLIRHGARTVWKAEVAGNDGTGVSPEVTLDVQKGDAIRFMVHKRGQITYDTTHWDPVVTYADGQRFQASEGFSTRRQGQNGWSYQMEVDSSDTVHLPCVHAFGGEFGLREGSTIVARPVEFSSADAQPLLVVADAEDKSGIVLAVASPDAWRFRSLLGRDGRLRVELIVGDEEGGCSLKPGESVALPTVFAGAYRGAWMSGVSMLQRLLGFVDADAADEAHRDVARLRQQLAGAFRRAMVLSDAEPIALPELDLWAMIQADWQARDKIGDADDAYSKAIARQIEKAGRLLTDLRSSQPDGFLADEAAQLERLTKRATAGTDDPAQLRSLYLRLRWLKRRIALANPLMQFGRLLVCKRVPTSYSHLVMQYYGFRARPGGGLFVIDRPGQSLACRDILRGKLDSGNVLEPRLSYDARRIVFSYVEDAGREYDIDKLDNETDEGFYHIWEVNVDGTGLRQLTRGPYDDVMPTCLPDGRIAFCSTRRRGYTRCFGGQFSRRWHVYTLHRMDADGGNVRALSYNDVNEWFPTVGVDGRIYYSRWDYIDRDAVTHQNLWATRPDGTNPIAVWGNATASPHCTFQIQPIPGSRKLIFTASAHHSIAGGSIAIVDPAVGNDGERALTRVTPEIPFPEAEGRNISEYYAAPWPLSERYYLVTYSPEALVWEPGANGRAALGVYLLDADGNRELIYRDPEIGSTNPCPLVVRPRPPILPSNLPEDAPPTGEIVLLDVYQGLGDVPRGTIKALRIVQIFPKSTHVANTPPIGLAREENARAILGTVPIESDGSAYFTVPAHKPLLFQALDKDGLAYQTMRSVTYVQPGERVSCIGCHERRQTAPPGAIARNRPPSPIRPDVLEAEPFSYVRVVQPVLDKHCVGCHSGRPDQKGKKGIDLTGRPYEGFTQSYVSLCGDRDFNGTGTNPKNAAEALVPRFGARNQVQVTPPGGMYGARGSRLIAMLRRGHHDVTLSEAELRRLAAWIDCNAIFYGDNRPEQQSKQLRGERIAMPDLQ